MRLTTTTNAADMIELDGLSVTNTTVLGIIGRLVDIYSDQAAKILNRHVTIATYTENFDVESGQTVFSLKGYPVTAFSSVVSDSTRTFTSGTVATTDYSATTGNGMLRIDGYALAPGYGALRVIYRGGMAASTATFISSFPDISNAVAAQVAYHWSRRKSLGRTGQNDGRGNVSYEGPVAWLPWALGVLNTHRRYTFGR